MVYINAYGACSALGADISEIVQNLKKKHAPGMRLTSHYLQNGSDVYLAHALYQNVSAHPRYQELIGNLCKRCSLNANYGISNNNKLLMVSYLQIDEAFNKLLSKLGVGRDRVAVIMGTSTAGSAESDLRSDFAHHFSKSLNHDQISTQVANSCASTNQIGGAAYLGQSSDDVSFSEPVYEMVARLKEQAKSLGVDLDTNNNLSDSELSQKLYKGMQELHQCNSYKAYGLNEAQALEHFAHYSYAMQELGDPSRFLSEVLQLSGPSYTISTACSSSLRAIISAARLIELGLCDVAIAGGADTLSRMTVNGFNSMSLVSTDGLCTPFAKNRAGITIGEASGLVVLSKEPSSIKIAGMGESSDAYHMSSPHPEGDGALKSMTDALKMAQIEAHDLGYVNLHGTGTLMNDAVESKVMAKLCPDVPCSSTKYLTGHTLGACGIWETVLCALLLDYAHELYLPEQDFSLKPQDGELDPINFVGSNVRLTKKYLMNNAFAFGGNNATIILAGE